MSVSFCLVVGNCAAPPDAPDHKCVLEWVDATRGRNASASRVPGEAENLPSPPAKAGGRAGVPTPWNVAEYCMHPAGACHRACRRRDSVAGYDGSAGWRDNERDTVLRCVNWRVGEFLWPARSVLPVKPDQLALNLHPVRRQDADFVGRIGRLERNRCAAAAEAF